MARYIDADAALNKLPDDLPYKASVKRVLMSAPTADVEEVVRCKDCVMCDRFYPSKASGEEPIEVYFCTVGRGHNTKPTDFCSYGERKDGDKDEQL